MADEENPYERFKQHELILRDELALDRTVLANERTFLSYVRTSLSFAVVGGTVVKLSDSPKLRLLGMIFLILSALWLAFGIWRAVAMQRRIRSCKRMVEEEAHRSP